MQQRFFGRFRALPKGLGPLLKEELDGFQTFFFFFFFFFCVIIGGDDGQVDRQVPVSRGRPDPDRCRTASDEVPN